MPKAVASKTKAVQSSKKHDGDVDKSGSWIVTVPAMTTDPAVDLLSEKGDCIHQAMATFMYVGAGAQGVPVPIPAPAIVTLEAGTDQCKPTLLKHSSKDVLVEGDKKEDNFGNVVEVDAVSAKLFTDPE